GWAIALGYGRTIGARAQPVSESSRARLGSRGLCEHGGRAGARACDGRAVRARQRAFATQRQAQCRHATERKQPERGMMPRIASVSRVHLSTEKLSVAS